MGLFSGLEKLGLGKLNDIEVFDEDKKKKDDSDDPQKKNMSSTQNWTEEDFLFAKTYECPVCMNEFHAKSIRTGRAKILSTDRDLRPKYQTIDTLKYDALVCPNCGYAALSRFFKYILPAQAKLIRENISANFSGIDESGSVYSYDEAILRHKLALANAIVKKAKTSEKSYICLKTAWLYRGKAESLPKDTPNYQEEVKDLQSQELELLTNACEGFMQSYSCESFPMCGMDELTVMYLVAELCRRTGKYDESGRWISKILLSRSANERIKNKARAVKEQLEKDKAQIQQ